MAASNVIHFPKQSKRPRRKKNPKAKCTVLQWIRNGYVFRNGCMLIPTVEYLPKKPE